MLVTSIAHLECRSGAVYIDCVNAVPGPLTADSASHTEHESRISRLKGSCILPSLSAGHSQSALTWQLLVRAVHP